MGAWWSETILWLIVASLVVLVIMHPLGFVQDVSSVSGAIQGESKILTGSGYAA